ncbi:glycosyltransferase [Deinococcus ruber]|uniref:glycosyltransferase n=1 Tax=Deinococcus ruber TaxID=1848197 RepID=UPI00166DE7E1|nr:glycosyltransferase [Deinococcus ruber]
MPSSVPPDSAPPFVFQDAGGRRWRSVRLLLLLVGGTVGLILALLGLSVILRPQLPALALVSSAPVQERHEFLTRVRQAAGLHTAGRVPLLPALRRSSGPAEVAGFYVNWDDNSFSSLKQHLSSLTELDPEWLHLTAAGLTPDDPLKTAALLDYLKRQHSALQVLPLVNNYDNGTQRWDSTTLSAVLGDSGRRATLETGLLAYARQVRGSGLMIDFEQVPPSVQQDFVTFLTALHARMVPLHLRLSVALPLDDDNYAYTQIAQAVDRVHLMAYDEHDDGGEAGPIASQGWLQRTLQMRLAQIPVSEVVLDVGNYGYDWRSGHTGGAADLSFQDAITLASSQQSSTAGGTGKLEDTVQLDPLSLNPTFSYQDAQHQAHTVWYLDAVSTFDSVQAARRLGVVKVALWRMGTEDPRVWQVLSTHALSNRDGLNAALAAQLRPLPYGYDLSYQGKGELLRVVSEPHDGLRDLEFGAGQSLITAEHLTRPASPFVIGRWGTQHPRDIALTFDDGPDPVWTPQVLDILKRAQAPATFFVVGLQAQQFPALLRREVQDGHEIGSHTYTHPNLSMVSHAQVGLELDATQRLIQSILGRGTLLFRPPFAEDVEPATPEQARVLQQASSLGYTTVGMGVDPEDWAKPGTQQIVKSVLAQVQASRGQVVLLHDAGGNRAQTVAALPLIIAELRAHGYHLVTVSQLAGLSSTQVMPPVLGLGAYLTRAGGWGFTLVSGFGLLIGTLFVLGILLSCLRLAFISVLGLAEALSRRGRDLPPLQIPLTVLVPAYNEARVINKTVQSLLTQGENVRVLVIDDGSRDDTAGVARAAFGEHPRVEIYSVPNGGKASALNHGLRLARTEVVVVIDADTVLEVGALAYLAAHFADARVAAVAGNAKVGNRVNLLTRWQALEYITAQNVERRAMALLNCVSVVPGAIGAWRAGVLLAVGGFATDTLAEDADLTLRVLRAGHKVTYEQRAIALTEAPDTVRGFLKQRFRWMYGILQATWKQRHAARQGHARLGLITVPNVLLFQVLLPLISAVLDSTMLVGLLWAGLQTRYHPDSPGMNGHLLLFYLLFIAIDLFAAVLAFSLEPGEHWSLLLWLPLQRFFYRQLLYLVAIRALLAALRGGSVGWGKLERRGTVKGPDTPPRLSGQ